MDDASSEVKPKNKVQRKREIMLEGEQKNLLYETRIASLESKIDKLTSLIKSSSTPEASKKSVVFTRKSPVYASKYVSVTYRNDPARNRRYCVRIKGNVIEKEFQVYLSDKAEAVAVAKMIERVLTYFFDREKDALWLVELAESREE